MFRLLAVLIPFSVSLAADGSIQEEGKPLDLPDITAIMQTAFKVVGSPISPQQYLSTLEREQSLVTAGLDPSFARNEKISGFNSKAWELADKGFNKSLAGFQLRRAGIGLIKTLDILEQTKKVDTKKGVGLLMAIFRDSGQDIDSVKVAKIMADARKMRDAGGEGWVIFTAHGIDLNFPTPQREQGQ